MKNTRSRTDVQICSSNIHALKKLRLTTNRVGKIFSYANSIFVLAILCQLFGCTQDYADVATIVIPNNSNRLIGDASDLNLIIDSITISNSLTHEIGTEFTTYYELEGGLLLVDRNVSKISCVSVTGQLLWQISSPSKDNVEYGLVGSVDVDRDNGKIYIDDRMNSKIDIFNLSGEYMSSLNSVLYYQDFTSLDEDRFIFDIANIGQNYGKDTIPKRLMTIAKDDSEDIVLFSQNYWNENPDIVPVSNQNRFNTVGNTLQHRRPFEDTVYIVNKSLDVEPILKFSFNVGSDFVDLASNKNTPDVWLELNEQNLPEPNLILYNQEKSIAYCSYWQGNLSYFAILTNGEASFAPSRYIQTNKDILKVPMYYSDGTFFQQMFKKERNLVNKTLSRGSERQINTQLDSINSVLDDRDDIIVYSMKFG
ncbi:6-bladed beta-propeller [Neolewinella sp.]|uniref:6-bladed beta-propeller n=1 Tax=Neolewinella sp. TaxID=2993543 RepID=UPI003B51888B